MKTQVVKNAPIVPVGAKGAFVRRNPDISPAQAYSTFVRGMLDLADNIVDGRIVHPDRTVVHGGDDAYLVVAVDKGTARFSDLANSIAAEYDYWLGDAFASGGSSGYDHKAMGITARGAWVAVREHFTDLGIDVETTEVTAVGIGDMSGDVFGNGMLLSPHLRLVGAFDHRHIFLDPDPDTARAYAERRRLFELPGSSWDDFDRDILSAGGRRVAALREVRHRPGTGTAPARTVPPDHHPGRVDQGAADGPGGSALERRRRHLRQGILRKPHRSSGPGKRPRPCRRLAAAVPRRRRGREPRFHAAGPHRVRGRGRARQCGLHRQRGRRGHLRRRGEPEDRPRIRPAQGRSDPRGTQPAARRRPRRGGPDGAAHEPGPGGGARTRRLARGPAARQARAAHHPPRDRRRTPAQHRGAAHRAGTGRPRRRRPRVDQAGDRGAARPVEERRVPGSARVGRARRPRLRRRRPRVLPRRHARRAAGRDPGPSSAPRDRRDPDRLRSRRPRRSGG